jgi:hypothetical protein
MTRTRRHPALLAAALVASLSSAGASETLQVVDPYVRAVPAGQNQTAAYMTLRNSGQKNLALTQAASPAARAVELHTVVDEGGLKKMRPVPKIDIPAGGETRLQPGGLHIMLIGLKEPLKEGANVALTLTFDDGRRQDVRAPIRAVEATVPTMHHAH